ncbi:MAG TPA: hypothetical protein VLD19_00240, partial [Chitinophagaceae bacterium]|nr:hypothetical protein [Chitinophagaceae bacterium]
MFSSTQWQNTLPGAAKEYGLYPVSFYISIMNILPAMLRFYALMLFFLTGAYCGLNAQDENKFRLYTTADGLSDNGITGIVQDCHGYIWAGTYRGLNRYDGTRFIQFHAGSGPNALPDESVAGMDWLDKTRLAVYTGMG